jgi:hypothetical protein
VWGRETWESEYEWEYDGYVDIPQNVVSYAREEVYKRLRLQYTDDEETYFHITRTKKRAGWPPLRWNRERQRFEPLPRESIRREKAALEYNRRACARPGAAKPCVAERSRGRGDS